MNNKRNNKKNVNESSDVNSEIMQEIRRIFFVEKFELLGRSSFFKYLSAESDLSGLFQDSNCLQEESMNVYIRFFQWAENQGLPVAKLFANLFDKEKLLPPNGVLAHCGGRSCLALPMIFDSNGKQVFPATESPYVVDFECQQDLKNLLEGMKAKFLGDMEDALGSSREETLLDFLFGTLDLKFRMFTCTIPMTESIPQTDYFGNFSLLFSKLLENFRKEPYSLNTPYVFVILQGEFFFQTASQKRFQEVLTLIKKINYGETVVLPNLQKLEIEVKGKTFRVKKNPIAGVDKQFYSKEMKKISIFLDQNATTTRWDVGIEFVKYFFKNIKENGRKVLLLAAPNSPFKKYLDVQIGLTFPKNVPPSIKNRFHFPVMTPWNAVLAVCICIVDCIRESVRQDFPYSFSLEVQEQVEWWANQEYDRLLKEYSQNERVVENLAVLKDQEKTKQKNS